MSANSKWKALNSKGQCLNLKEGPLTLLNSYYFKFALTCALVNSDR